LKGGGQQQNPPDQSLDLFLIIGFIVVVVIFLWYYYSEQIVRAIFAVRMVEASIMLKILSFIDDMSEFIEPDMVALVHLKSAMYYMSNVPPSQVTYSDLLTVSTRFGKSLALPVILVGAGGVVYALFFHRFSRFNQVHTMVTLSRQESKNWPQITPVIGKEKELIEGDIKQGPWRMSDQPLGFAKEHGLLRTEVEKGQTIARLDKGKAKSVFCAQMGPLWTGLEDVPPYVLALFAIFCAKAENDTDGARTLIRQISASASSGRLNFSGTRILLFKHVRSPKVGRAVSPHAYLYTVMASMLTLARRDGVLSVSEFLWLKTLDRKLWYVLSNVGRQTTFVEVAAPMSHWMVECRLRRPLKVPVVEPAIEALDEALADILINPDEDE